MKIPSNKLCEESRGFNVQGTATYTDQLILVNKQLDAHFFFRIYIYSNSLHVLSTPVLILRRINCINMIYGIRHCV